MSSSLEGLKKILEVMNSEVIILRSYFNNFNNKQILTFGSSREYICLELSDFNLKQKRKKFIKTLSIKKIKLELLCRFIRACQLVLVRTATFSSIVPFHGRWWRLFRLRYYYFLSFWRTGGWSPFFPILWTIFRNTRWSPKIKIHPWNDDASF